MVTSFASRALTYAVIVPELGEFAVHGVRIVYRADVLRRQITLVVGTCLMGFVVQMSVKILSMTITTAGLVEMPVT